jgi:hypothetical protein
MIRTILISAAFLAAAGAANAEQVKVSLTGKTESTIRTELFQAAKTVCSKDAAVSEYLNCVEETYQTALSDVAKVKATKLASLTF